MKIIKYSLIVLLVVGGLGVTFYFNQSENQKARESFNILSGPRGGVYQVVAVAMTEVISAKLPNTIATMSPSFGSIDNVKAIDKKRSQAAIAMLDAATAGYRGSVDYNRESQDVRVMAKLYKNRMHLVVFENSDIKTVADLNGKRLGTGPTGSGIAFMTDHFIKANKLDVISVPLTLTESSYQLENGGIDAFIVVGGVPTREVTNLATKRPIRLINTGDSLDAMNKLFGGYNKSVIKAGSYPGITEDVSIVETDNVLIVPASMSNKRAYEITKALFENQKELEKRHVVMKNLIVENQTPLEIPYHPGAQKYFNEQRLRVVSK